jgi:hypothetical protein
MAADRRVERFRSIEEMNSAPVRTTGASDFDRFLRQCARYWALSRKTYPRGVFRFHTLAEAQAARAVRPAASESRR